MQSHHSIPSITVGLVAALMASCYGGEPGDQPRCEGDLLLLESGEVVDCQVAGGRCGVATNGETACLPNEGGGPRNAEGTPRFLAHPLAYDARVVNGWYYNYQGNGVITKPHGAIDFQASVGTPLYAACGGVAMASSQYASGGGFGRFIQIRCDTTAPSGEHYHVLYAHVGGVEPTIRSYSEADRRTSDYSNWTPVSQGQRIGTSGSEDTTWAHLHFQVMLGMYCGTPVDPYDIYATTTDAAHSAEQEYPTAGSRFSGCGANFLWLSCPPYPAQPSEPTEPTDPPEEPTDPPEEPVEPSCPSGDGLYCGQSVSLTSGVLYRCTSGSYSQVEVCTYGCQVNPPGQNDVCAERPDECTSGPCCDSGQFKPSTSVCESDAQSEVSCAWGEACGSDVGIRYRDRYCSGFSAACDGSLGPWGSWQVHETCYQTEACDSASLSCVDCGASHISASPSSTWTQSFTPQTNCGCSSSDTDCHSLYVARVASLNGNTVTMQFMKSGGGEPSVPVHYWVVVGAATYPSCLDLHAFVVRKEGTWTASSQGYLSVSGINVWPDQASYDAAPCGDVKKLFIITGGAGGYENTRTWFQQRAIVFTKVCD